MTIYMHMRWWHLVLALALLEFAVVAPQPLKYPCMVCHTLVQSLSPALSGLGAQRENQTAVTELLKNLDRKDMCTALVDHVLPFETTGSSTSMARAVRSSHALEGMYTWDPEAEVNTQTFARFPCTHFEHGRCMWRAGDKGYPWSPFSYSRFPDVPVPPGMENVASTAPGSGGRSDGVDPDSWNHFDNVFEVAANADDDSAGSGTRGDRRGSGAGNSKRKAEGGSDRGTPDVRSGGSLKNAMRGMEYRWWKHDGHDTPHFTEVSPVFRATMRRHAQEWCESVAERLVVTSEEQLARTLSTGCTLTNEPATVVATEQYPVKDKTKKPRFSQSKYVTDATGKPLEVPAPVPVRAADAVISGDLSKLPQEASTLGCPSSLERVADLDPKEPPFPVPPCSLLTDPCPLHTVCNCFQEEGGYRVCPPSVHPYDPSRQLRCVLPGLLEPEQFFSPERTAERAQTVQETQDTLEDEQKKLYKEAYPKRKGGMPGYSEVDRKPKKPKKTPAQLMRERKEKQREEQRKRLEAKRKARK